MLHPTLTLRGARIVLRLASENERRREDSRYLEGHGDLISRSITRITRVTVWVIGAIDVVTKSP